jgi:hypothetical protein
MGHLDNEGDRPACEKAAAQRAATKKEGDLATMEALMLQALVDAARKPGYFDWASPHPPVDR